MQYWVCDRMTFRCGGSLGQNNWFILTKKIPSLNCVFTLISTKLIWTWFLYIFKPTIHSFYIMIMKLINSELKIFGQISWLVFVVVYDLFELGE